MNPQLPNDKTHHLVERICEQGCTVVRQHIESLIKIEQQDSLISLPQLLTNTSPAEQKAVLDELITIMAVYDNKDCDENSS